MWFTQLRSMHAQQVGGAHEYYLRTFQGVSTAVLEQQTAKMAEGGQTRAKCELSVSSAFGMCQAEMS